MSLSHAILATLSNGCYSGYDISKQFAGSVGFFWYATQQQIYRELGKLEEQGLSQCRGDQTGKSPGQTDAIDYQPRDSIFARVD
jgi:DNA-binding PadR family transcriptional regulator